MATLDDPATANINNDPSAGTFIGFDYGLKRIGLASGNSTTLTAMPLETISNHNGTPDWQRIDTLITEWQPTALVVGRPVQMDGTVQDITHHAMGFKRRLAQRYALPVFPADERRSSIEAAATIKKSRQLGLRGKTTVGDVDKIAATHILQRWLEEHFSI